MRFLIIGLGSMGKRRIRNLLANHIVKKNIAGFELNLDRAKQVANEYQIKVFTDYQLALTEWQPQAIIISTPPHLHAQYFLDAIKLNKHFFVEVATTDDGYATLIKKLKVRPDLIAAPSCTMRFFAPIQTIKKLIDQNKIGQTYLMTHHLGMYLPDWHPWEDYRQFYASRPESSAIKEMLPYELQWLSWLINEPFIKVQGLVTKLSDLEMKAPDTAVSFLQAKSGICLSLVIEVLARSPLRCLRVVGTQGIIEWNWQQWSISYFQVKTKKWTKLKLDPEIKRTEYVATTELMYDLEIKAWLQALAGKKKYPYSFTEDWQNLKLLNLIEHSRPKGK